MPYRFDLCDTSLTVYSIITHQQFIKKFVWLSQYFDVARTKRKTWLRLTEFVCKVAYQRV